MTRQVSLTADGDDPFADMKAMLSAYDYDSDDVAEIHVEIEVIEDTGETDETESSLTVTEDTLAGQCLKILADLKAYPGNDAVPVNDVAEHITEYSASGVGSSLSRLSRETPYVDRDRTSADGGGVKHLYRLTATGADKHEVLFE